MTSDERKEYNKKYREANKDKLKQYYENNKDKIKEYYENNKETIKETAKKYYENKKNKKKEYYENNKNTRLQYQRKYKKNRLLNDPLFKLTKNIRESIRKSLKKNGYTKTSKTFLILGCSFEDFKLHLETQFESWMNWDNYGLYNGTPNYGWDVDHIIPTSSAATEKELIKLNHYTNLQPLCSKVNRDIKKAKIDN
jgi:hypothetical protein